MSNAPGDSLRALHPELGTDATFATFVRRWRGEGQREWTLYAVTPVLRADGQVATSQRSDDPGSDR